MTNIEYVSFFENIARSHKNLRHEEPGAAYPTGKRKSFFRSNKEGEDVQAGMEQVDYPSLNLLPYHGRLQTRDMLHIEDSMTGGFDIRYHVADINDYAAIEDARDDCKTIAFSILAEMQRLWEEDGSCGPFTDLDLNNSTYDFIGPLNNSEFGIRIQFSFRDGANFSSFDLNDIFQR